MTTKREQRFDFGSFRSKPVKTPQGFLKVSGNLTRTGVLSYKRADGGAFRELRLPEEVFRPDSLETLAGAPVTDLHPSELVSPANVTRLQKGFVTESVKKDGRFISAPIIVQDAALIRAVEAGERRELSPGYTCRVDASPGTWDGEKYDAVQRDITYNHLALGPRGWGRSGSDVALKMDAAGGESGLVVARQVHLDGVALADFVRDRLSLKGMSERELAKFIGVDEFELGSLLEGWAGPIKMGDLQGVAEFIEQPTETLFAMVPAAQRGDGKNRSKRPMETVTIHIDGIAYVVPATAGPHITKGIESRDARITELQAKADAAEAKADAAEKSLTETKVKLDSAESPERLAEAVKARVELETKAAKLLGSEARFDGEDDQAVKLRCIKAADESFNADDRSSDYINARFDLLKPEEKTEPKSKKVVEILDATRKGERKDGDEKVDRYDADAAKARMLERNQNLWQKPLAASSTPKA